MKVLLRFTHYIFIVVVIGLLSCEKEFNTISSHNIPPVANAGTDQIAILPKDSVILDATASKDLDGNITTYHWTKIDGPASFTIVNAVASTTRVRSLVQGVYKFEMTVTDNVGSIGKDTVQVTVIAGSGTNQPPVADAGADQTVMLPTNLCTLNGRNSYDPDGSINAYQWTKVAGPSSFTIQDHTGVQTIVNNLAEGIYLFELMVTDNVGLNDKDTVQITVAGGGCDISSRSQVGATLTQIGTLSEARAPYVAAAGSKIVFAGGINQTSSGYIVSSAVDIYDVNTASWSTAQLSRAREGIATVSNGNKIFFAGGGTFFSAYDNIDIYDVSTGAWTVAHLSESRSYLTAAAVGNKVLFAGGYTNEENPSNKVDIYDISTNTWSTASLSEPKFNLSSVTVGNKIYFAGGNRNNDEVKSIDIYDDLNTANHWSASSLIELSGPVSGVAVGDNIYWGGIALQQNMGKAEQWNISNNNVTTSCLSYRRALPTAVVKNDNIVFFTSGIANTYDPITNAFDIYNIQSNRWSIGILNHAIRGAGIISLNNTIYVGGGELTYNSCSNKVYILSW